MKASLRARLFDEEPAAPRIGRYAIIDLLGDGGMGVVFRAYDPDLDRPVALKILHLDETQASSHRDRLTLEGKAMARLNHPNVRSVYEVGVDAGRLFVAMEYVEGGTLDRWCADNDGASRTHTQQRLDLFVQALVGLAAAHRAGLVHRDIKPTNILINAQGQLRLADFGVARLDTTAASSHGSVEQSSASQQVASVDARLTQTGAFVGTPAYMAPEQFDGRADERSDQFGLCATFYEVFYQARPFAGRTATELRENIVAGTFTSRSRSDVPKWLGKILRRGLAADPAQRFESIDALRDAVARGRRRTGPRVALAAGVVALVAVPIWLQMTPQPPVPCDGAEHELEGAWGDARRQQMRSAFETSGSPRWEPTWTRVAERLDAYTEAWAEQRRSACEAARGSAAERQRAPITVGCLEQARRALEFVSETLVQTDAEGLDKAVLAVVALPQPSRCVSASVQTLEAENATERTRDITDRLGQAHVRFAQGRMDEALTLAASARSIADAAGPLLLSRAEVDLSNYAAATGDDKASTTHAENGLAWAEMTADSTTLVTAWLQMADAYRDQRKLERAEFSLDQARRGALRLDPTDLLHPTLAQSAGRLASINNDAPGAVQLFRTAEEGFRRALGTGDPRTGGVVCDLAGSLMLAGEAEPGVLASQRCVDLQRALLGPEHPSIAIAQVSLARSLQWAGRPSEGLAVVDAAISTYLSNPSFWPLAAADAHLIRGMLLKELQEPDKSLAAFERAEAIIIHHRGEDDAARLQASSAIAGLHLRQGRSEEAVEAYEDLLRRFGSAAGRGSSVGTMHANLAQANGQLGRKAEAAKHLERSRELLGKLYDPSSAPHAQVLLMFAQIWNEVEEPQAALAELEAVRPLIIEGKYGAAAVGRMYREQAKAHAGLRSWALARQDVTNARKHLDAAGQAGEEPRSRLEAWLDEADPRARPAL